MKKNSNHRKTFHRFLQKEKNSLIVLGSARAESRRKRFLKIFPQAFYIAPYMFPQNAFPWQHPRSIWKLLGIGRKEGSGRGRAPELQIYFITSKAYANFYGSSIFRNLSPRFIIHKQATRQRF